MTPVGEPQTATPVDGRFALLTYDGQSVGHVQKHAGGALVEMPSLQPYRLPNAKGGFFNFQATSDGRTLLAYGDPLAWEHSMQLDVSLFRDGQEIFSLGEPVTSDSELALSPSGVGMFFYTRFEKPEERVLTVFDTNKGVRTEVALPYGTRGSDPVQVDDRVYFRLFPAQIELKSKLAYFDGRSIVEVMDTPGCIQLIQVHGSPLLFLRTGKSLTAWDPNSKKAQWTLDAEIRPRSLFSWSISKDSGQLAVLTLDRQFRGEPTPIEKVKVIEMATGELVGSSPVKGIPYQCQPYTVWSNQYKVQWTGGGLRLQTN